MSARVEDRARGERLSLPVLLSFNELAWILVFALAALLAATSARARHQREELESERARLMLERGRSERAYHSLLAGDAVVRKELVGLRGELRNVAFLVDRSGSMAKDGRWAQVRDIVRLWIERLAVERAVLVAFNDRTDVWPPNRMLFDMTGGEAAKNRAALVKYFSMMQPSGNTNTLAALERVHTYPEVDTVVLFTDGAPDSGSGFDPEMVEEIHALSAERARSGRQLPVNVVALGDYFDPRFAAFLTRLARESGGSFLGR